MNITLEIRNENQRPEISYEEAIKYTGVYASLYSPGRIDAISLLIVTHANRPPLVINIGGFTNLISILPSDYWCNHTWQFVCTLEDLQLTVSVPNLQIKRGIQHVTRKCDRNDNN